MNKALKIVVLALALIGLVQTFVVPSMSNAVAEPKSEPHI